MADLAAAKRLADIYGSDPSAVGATDGTEDDFGDLINDALSELGRPCDTLDDKAYDHVQAVATECRATTMPEWLDHIEAALR
jgi:hypothetical protein